MEDDFLLMNPGPVPLEQKIRDAMSLPMISHRSEEFEKIYNECSNLLNDVFQTDNDILIFNSSGSGAMEAGVSNLIKPDDVVVSLVNGKFGRRFRRISERYTNSLREINVRWGDSFSLEEIDKVVDKDVDAVTMVHNETSTGILNPVSEVAEIAEENGALFIMDGVTSIGGDDVRIDDWGVDVAVVGSQKCIGAPPGLSALSISKEAKNKLDSSNSPFYLDGQRHLEKLQDNQTPYTSSISLFRGLREALRIIKEEGLGKRIERHRRLSKLIRESVTTMGLNLFADLKKGSQYSNTVTAIDLPEGTSDKDILSSMKKRNISISGGQAHLGGEIIRIATMANITDNDVLRVIKALQEILEEKIEIEGNGVEVAEDILSQ